MAAAEAAPLLTAEEHAAVVAQSGPVKEPDEPPFELPAPVFPTPSVGQALSTAAPAIEEAATSPEPSLEVARVRPEPKDEVPAEAPSPPPAPRERPVTIVSPPPPAPEPVAPITEPEPAVQRPSVVIGTPPSAAPAVEVAGKDEETPSSDRIWAKDASDVPEYVMVAPVELQFTASQGRVGVKPGTRSYAEFQRLAGILLEDLKRARGW